MDRSSRHILPQRDSSISTLAAQKRYRREGWSLAKSCLSPWKIDWPSFSCNATFSAWQIPASWKALQEESFRGRKSVRNFSRAKWRRCDDGRNSLLIWWGRQAKWFQEEASQAEEMRNMSLETFRQSQERSQDGQPKQKKKKRASGADTMTFLKERVEIESRQRLEELEIRKRELLVEKEAKEAELNLRAKEHKERVEQQRIATQLQQQQQQQLQNMNMALLQQQQQQQTQALMTLLQKFTGK